ncbi:hypothetical protein AX16_001197 [Volvariella volvacea WC 439]|nr:hypothetical protein AX16_001197 [Volvariella volvacea WC 439]
MPSQPSSRVGYVPVNQVEEFSLDESPKLASEKLPPIVLFLCVLLTAINFLLLLLPNAGGVELPTYEDVQSLRRPSQFIGMDELYRKSHPTSGNLTNFPFLISQVDGGNSEYVFDTDPKRCMTKIGSISPNARQIRVTSTISTIFQFRILDFGLEQCELQLSLPNSTQSPEHTQYLSLTRTVNVLRLNAAVPLNERELSHRSKPRSIQSIGWVALMSGVLWSYEFSCRTDEILTFELTCEGLGPEECDVSWWQDRNVSPLGLVIIQHPSL